ncbi:VOC family protein [Yinghuangia seranimata]|uniref:VOC family protein n=1 Tax=Yinghuangia seranimata TaxID=408067 RepID=UPI00248B9D3D|nr:VOC family protein [Yinghuangia seranimata]MDI2129790.1 extradiol dioxygenase [Yinghuangia seranimata]
MINGAHVILYSRDAEADRAFFRDVLRYPYVDAGHGWLIFKAPPTELAMHPTDDAPSCDLYLMCDDLAATTEDLVAHNVEITKSPESAGWGLVTAFRLPGGGEVGLYQPRHPRATDLP